MTKAQPTSKRLVRLKEGASYLSVSPWTLRRIVQAGEIPIVKIGGEGSPWLLDRQDLDSFIDRHKEKIE